MPEGESSRSRACSCFHGTCRNRGDVDLDRRHEFFAGDWLDGLAEHMVNRELASLHGDVRILAVQLLLSQSRELFFGQKCVEQGLDRIGAFVPCALLAATEFFVTFLESSHPHYFLTTLVWIVPDSSGLHGAKRA
jgi:hypothetical protein